MIKSKKRVVVAMSGGVDSSVAAHLLKKRGYEVVGVTMCLSLDDAKRKKPGCCGIQGIEDARRVAEKLGIRHYVLNFGKHLEEKIINNFCQEYLRGRTPNPCVRCNQFLKFDILLNKAKQMNADYLATGHYASIVYNRKNKEYLLKKGKDKQKDQSYFLYSIKKEALPYILLPLGDYTKREVRAIAKRIGLKVADKPGSQEICFIDTNYREFLRRELPRIFKTRMNANRIKPGPIVDIEGNVLGQHKGVPFYTIGQREGLGIALGYRAYIIKIDAKNNTIVVGKEDELYSDGLIAEDLNFLSIDFPKKPMRAQVMIRYNNKPTPCRIIPLTKNRIKVEFLKPQRAVTPGQSVVFYDKDILLGGGIIRNSL